VHSTLLAHGRWFSPGTLASSITKTGRHNIAESGVKHNKLIIDFDLGYLKKVIPETMYVVSWVSQR
jgi:hypothetical protein